MEQDPEIKGEGNHIDFGARGYDPRLGRWWSVDPQFKQQAGWSTYKAFLDNPIVFVDPEGEIEYGTITVHNEITGKTKTVLYTAQNIMTDGIRHEVKTMGGVYASENRYYDFSTSITYTITKEGVSRSETSKVIYGTSGLYKDADYIWSGAAAAGDIKLDVPGYLYEREREWFRSSK